MKDGLRAGGVLLVVSMMLGMTGCAGTTNQGEAQPPPPWWNNPPEDCVVGTSGPTYYLEDGVRNSTANGLKRLAEEKKIRVQGTFEMMQTEGYTNVQDSVTIDTDVVIESAKFKEMWVSSGENPTWGPEGMIYSLVCVEE